MALSFDKAKHKIVEFPVSIAVAKKRRGKGCTVSCFAVFEVGIGPGLIISSDEDMAAIAKKLTGIPAPFGPGKSKPQWAIVCDI